MKVIFNLGLCVDAQIPVTMHIHTVNNNGIKILGVAILRFSDSSKSGPQRLANCLLYVTREADKLFLSQKTCKALGMMSEKFPTVGKTLCLKTKMEPEMASAATG